MGKEFLIALLATIAIYLETGSPKIDKKTLLHLGKIFIIILGLLFLFE